MEGTQSLYVQYGCGLAAPKEWINYDASPTLRIQKLPLIGRLVRGRLPVVFPDNVRYGDIIKGLPVAEGSCQGVYCSHTLEHLSLADFRMALRNTYRIMKKGGIFRCVVPDLEGPARRYLTELELGKRDASVDFLGKNTLMGMESRPRGLKGMIRGYYGNSLHLWMWDKQSLAKELEDAGFVAVRVCGYGDCEDGMFRLVESEDRFVGAVAIECRR